VKWLLVAVLLAIPVLSLWVRLSPRSRVGRAARLLHDPRDSLQRMDRRRLARGGSAFLLFALAALSLAAAMLFSAHHRGWPSLDSPFAAALAGASATIGGLALLVGLYLLVAAALSSKR
jgi:hypothetical protein